MSSALDKQIAHCLVYLMIGFEESRTSGRELHNEYSGVGSYDAEQKLQEETYELHADIHGGHIGIVSDMYDNAEWIEGYLSECYPTQEFPGVIAYEVYEPLGAWLFAHPEKTFDHFVIHAKDVIDNWFAEGVARHNAALVSLGRVPAADPATTALPTLNASQPADVTKESTTMKISDLISQLDSLRGDLGDVDVVIGGSAVGKFVDVQEVRRVKTPKRTTVYIGKTTKPNAQE